MNHMFVIWKKQHRHTHGPACPCKQSNSETVVLEIEIKFAKIEYVLSYVKRKQCFCSENSTFCAHTTTQSNCKMMVATGNSRYIHGFCPCYVHCVFFQTRFQPTHIHNKIDPDFQSFTCNVFPCLPICTNNAPNSRLAD